MSVLKCIIVLFLMVECTWCKNYTGKPCTAEKFDISGVCKRVYECPFAAELFDVKQKKAPICGYEDKVVIACCPSQNLLYRTGVFKDYFKGSNDGIITSKDMTCRYEGRQPLLCCENKPARPNPPEPVQCPPLPKPKLTVTINNKEKVIEHFLWDKCVEYQRYFNKCVEADGMPGTYIRQNTCGIPPRDENTERILNGDPARPRQFPHMAVVGCHNTVYSDPVDIIWIGGGSLISERFILTAAHVLVENTHGRVRYALMGTLDKKDTKGLLLNVVRTVPHKQYVKGQKDHDIALLELHERVKFNEFIRPACLPLPGQKVESKRIISGWGQTGETEQTSDVLLYASIGVTEHVCDHKLHGMYVPKRMICAGGSVGSIRHDSCKGDSGGPLMALFTNLECSYAIEGIVSFGPRCGGNVGVYTRVSYYLDWIIENAWPEEWKKMNKNT